MMTDDTPMTMNVFTLFYTQYFVMASTQLPSGLLGDSIALLLPSNQVPSGAALKVKSPSAATVTQPNRYHLDMMQLVLCCSTLLRKPTLCFCHGSQIWQPFSSPLSLPHS